MWRYEVVSVLAKAERKGAITGDKVHGFLEDLRALEIEIDGDSLTHILDDVHRLALNFGLSGYDAAYLELAIRRGFPLATLDEDLQTAARLSGVALFQLD